MLLLEALLIYGTATGFFIWGALWLRRRAARQGYTVELRPDSETAVAIGRTVLQPGERTKVRPALSLARERPDDTPTSDPVSTAAAVVLMNQLFDEPPAPAPPLTPETFEVPTRPERVPDADPFADFPTDPSPSSDTSSDSSSSDSSSSDGGSSDGGGSSGDY